VQKTREAAKAWRTIIAFITDQLRCGFDGEAKYYSRYFLHRQADFGNSTTVQLTHRHSLADSEMEHKNEEPPGDTHQTDTVDLTRKLQQMRMDYESAVDSFPTI
jgi:hypothetical protein